MPEMVSATLSYEINSDSCENDIMLFELGLYQEATRHGLNLACFKIDERMESRIVVSGPPKKMESFFSRLKSKSMDLAGVDNYTIGDKKAYAGKAPDWEYGLMLNMMKAAYLRTAYMEDVAVLLERLSKKLI